MVPPDRTNGEIREALLALALAMSTHVNSRVEPSVNVLRSTMISKLRGFMSMNPPIFLGSKLG